MQGCAVASECGLARSRRGQHRVSVAGCRSSGRSLSAGWRRSARPPADLVRHVGVGGEHVVEINDDGRRSCRYVPRLCSVMRIARCLSVGRVVRRARRRWRCAAGSCWRRPTASRARTSPRGLDAARWLISGPGAGRCVRGTGGGRASAGADCATTPERRRGAPKGPSFVSTAWPEWSSPACRTPVSGEPGNATGADALVCGRRDTCPYARVAAGSFLMTSSWTTQSTASFTGALLHTPLMATR